MYEKKEQHQVYSTANVDRKQTRPQRKFTKLIDTVDNILNVLLDEELIELSPMVQHFFPNGVPENYRYEEFYSYHRTPGYLTKNCRILRNIFQEFIDNKAIQMDDNPEADEGLVHPDNG